MRRYVISAPRSGLNWLRYCVEHHYGVRTPGRQEKLYVPDAGPGAFIRSHDPLWAGVKRNNAQYRRIDPEQTAGGLVLLILRDPLETFVRMAERKFSAFAAYPSNIRFFTEAVAARKAIYYYEDLIVDPSKMAEAMAFLDIAPAPGRPIPTLASITNEWELLAERSRASYDDATGGGAMTKSRPHDFKFHQRSLWWWQKSRVWHYLERSLSSEEMRHLDRYR